MDLKIEDLTLTMGGKIDRDRLPDPPFHKVGLVRRLLTGKPAQRVLFTADNSRLQCLADDFAIFPCIDSYLDKDRRWETRASVYLEDGRLNEVVFRVIDGRYAAANFMDRFADLCTAALGEPLPGSGEGTTWHNGNTVVSGVLHPNLREAEFRFILQDD